jgi:hypothetical protein
VASTASRQPQDRRKKKRTKKTACSMTVEEEELMVDFIQDNPILWNVRILSYYICSNLHFKTFHM